MKYFTLTFSILSTICFSTYAQKVKKGIEHKLNVERVISATEIVWYGVDFSKCRITDGSKMHEADMMKEKFIPSWISLMNKDYDLHQIQKRLKKTATEDFNTLQKLYTTIDTKELVTFSSYSFPIDSVKSFINSYPMPEKNGIGLVLIIENLNKPERYVSGYFTFFDINTREVLYATKMKGLPGSKYGFTQWWKEGLVELFEYYFNDYYRKID